MGYGIRSAPGIRASGAGPTGPFPTPFPGTFLGLETGRRLALLGAEHLGGLPEEGMGREHLRPVGGGLGTQERLQIRGGPGGIRQGLPKGEARRFEGFALLLEGVPMTGQEGLDLVPLGLIQAEAGIEEREGRVVGGGPLEGGQAQEGEEGGHGGSVEITA